MKIRTLAALLISTILLGNVSIPTQANPIQDEHSQLFKTIVVKDGTNLDIVKCVALAFKNSPNIKRKKYQLDLAKSNVGKARSVFFPVIGAGVGFYNENNSNGKFYYNHYRELPNVAVSVNQLVFDFGKSTANIKMEEFYKIGAEYEFIDSLCSTLFHVKEKYYELLKAQALAKIAEDNVLICKKYLQMAKGAPDKTTARFFLGRAYYEYTLALTKLKNAKLDLSNAMFIDNSPNYNIVNTKTFNYNHDYGYTAQYIPPKFKPYKFNFSREDAVNIAYENSPDLRVLESTKSAMEQALKYVKRKYLPDLNANVGYGSINPNITNTNNSLHVGVNLSTNINLMELKHSLKGADAQIKLADNEIVLFKKDLFYEVKKALNNIDFAESDIGYAQNTAKIAIENINTVERLYKNGQLNYVALQEARKNYITAMEGYVLSLAYYNQTLIQVEEAMHYHIVDIHHKTQHAMTKHSDELIEHLNEALDCDGQEKKSKKHKETL